MSKHLKWLGYQKVLSWLHNYDECYACDAILVSIQWQWDNDQVVTMLVKYL